MASPVIKIADVLGTAIGTYHKSRFRARYGKRPSFLEAWTAEGKWQLSDASTRQAQRRAIQNSWVFTAISMIAREVSAADFEVVEYRGIDAKPVQIANHPLEELLRRPNPYMGQAFLWQFTTWWIELNGNGYWFIGLDGDGRVAELWPLPAEGVEPVPGDAERFVDHYAYMVGGREYKIPAEYIVHIKLPNPFNIFRGMSPLKAAMLPVDTDTAMARWNASFFGRDNVMPSAIINLSSGNAEVPIDPADAQMLKDDLKSEYQAFKRKTAVTTAAKLEVELLGWNPKDLDFISGRQFTKEEIYEIYGIPGGLFDKNATRANSENADKVFGDKTLWPLLVLIAEQLTAELVMPFYGQQYAATFADVRVVNQELMLQEVASVGPYLTIDEVRKEYYKRDPLPDGRGEQTATEAQSMGGGGLLEGEFEPELPRLPPSTSGSPQTPRQLPPSVNSGGTVSPKPKSELGELAALDLRKWKTKAVNAVKRNRPLPVNFRSDILPFYIISRIRTRLMFEEELRSAKMLQDRDLLPRVKAVFEEVPSLDPFEVGAAKAPRGKRRRPWDRWGEYLRQRVRGYLRREARRLTDRVREEGQSALLDDKFWIEHRAGFAESILDVLTGMSRLGIRHGRERLNVHMQGLVDWDLVNNQAADWARDHAARLVTQVTDETRKRLRGSVADWIEAGEALPDLEKRVLEQVDNPKRAKVIAQTESTSAYAEGNAQAWTAAGITPAAFKPPAHVNCRCYLQPYRLKDKTWVMVWYTVMDERVCVQPIQTPWGVVKGCRALHRTIVSEGPNMGRKI